ncbi:CsbD family protein [Ornithobacterium rhinotracheale]|nr:CsbD family protein [Ornithobacterium rhinotracheale]AIP98983.1 general stress protein CsbD [Ornithobacterium rhinotracheale ORT-UMN 88]KGB67258.1 hypothetical protein Q787_03350 [Ornithobacterium rhinotracheale H06-030791]MBN3661959.1 CsbD family protein [Ornithobacterium rhinotracheale]MCK0195157.1 CsbD family protein [Ornithobacterium rhinotracheale]MCK0200387.1 CsbD family protein [Ornithobacterium rhinotracheale]
MSSLDDKLKGNWNQLKGKVKQQWGDLTDDDLTYTEGKSEELLGRLQEKTGEAKETISKFFEDLFSSEEESK